jgi:hypothetical protein
MLQELKRHETTQSLYQSDESLLEARTVLRYVCIEKVQELKNESLLRINVDDMLLASLQKMMSNTHCSLSHPMMS